jgi:hypothetical protein
MEVIEVIIRRYPVYLAVCCVVSLVLLVGCGRNKKESAYGPGNEWVNDMRDQIQKNIDDPEKVTKLLAVVDEIEIVLMEMDQAVLVYYATLDSLDADYNSTREDFQSVIDAFNVQRLERSNELVGHMFEMKRIAGREDWKTVSDIDKTLYESWQRTFTVD